MPINPSALGDSAPDDPMIDEKLASPDPDDAPETKRKRRTKAEMLADAVVPGDNVLVHLKDSGTGAKIERTWIDAVALVREGKADWVDKEMKYSLLKYEQQQEENQGEPHDGAPSDPGSESKSPHIPEGAQPGDEVEINGDPYRVGHGGVLTTSPVQTKPEDQSLVDLGREIVAEQNGNGDGPEAQTLPAGVNVEHVGNGEWKVGTGILEKIGLPDYSSLQIGPISASRTVADDGTRVEVDIGDRKALIPANVVTVAQEAMDIVEWIARYQRGELVSFLESTGALKQPVS